MVSRAAAPVGSGLDCKTALRVPERRAQIGADRSPIWLSTRPISQLNLSECREAFNTLRLAGIYSPFPHTALMRSDIRVAVKDIHRQKTRTTLKLTTECGPSQRRVTNGGEKRTDDGRTCRHFSTSLLEVAPTP